MTASEARPTPPDTSNRALIVLAWPLLIANLAVVGNGTIDTVMAGRLSAGDLAAVALGSSIYVTVYISLMGVLQALSPIAGHHYGAHRWRAIGDDVQQALWLAVFLTAAGLPVLLAKDLWLGVARPQADVAAMTTDYLLAIACGLPAALATRVYIALNAAVARPKVTMLVNLTALALKAPLNALFMYGSGPIPELGAAGAGVSTAVLAWLTLALNFAVWRLDPHYARMRSTRPHSPQWSRQLELLKLGVPIGLATLFEVTSFTLMAVLIARLGTAAVGGHQIVVNLISLLFMVPLSLGIASSVLVAQSLGAGDSRVARRAALRGFRVAMTVALATATALWLMRDTLVGWYTGDAEVAAVALSLIWLAAPFHVFDACQVVAGFVLRGYKNTFWPMVIYGVALWGIGLIGGAWIGLSPSPFGPARGVLGFWEAATVALVLAAVLLAVLANAVSRRRITEA
jgi:MATE family multidrug resistance protein